VTMTFKIDIPEDLAARASVVGLSPADLSRLAAVGVHAEFVPDGRSGIITVRHQLSEQEPEAHSDQITPPHEALPAGGALLRELDDDGLLTGYGDSSIDAPELARQLRERPSDRGDETVAEPTRKKYSVLNFAGVGAGQPGTVAKAGLTAQEHIDSLRSEWEK